MEYTHIQKNIGHSPRKLRLVADMVRKMTPEQALDTLQFARRAASPDFAKAIKTILANAGNKEGLSFKKIEINEGLKIKRYRPAPRGRIRPYVKRSSHIKIVLTDEVRLTEEKSVKKMKETNKKAEVVISEPAEKVELKDQNISEEIK